MNKGLVERESDGLLIDKMFKNTYDSTNDKVMEKGVVISGIALSIAYIILDMMDRNKYIKF